MALAIKTPATPIVTVETSATVEVLVTAVKKYAASKAKTSAEIVKQHSTREVIRAWHEANPSLVDSLKVKLGEDLSKVYNRIVTVVAKKKAAPEVKVSSAALTVDMALDFLTTHGYVILKNGNLAKAK